MSDRIDVSALDRLFLQARTHNAWQDRDVPDALLRELLDIVRMGPTSANCCPARSLFVKSREAKERLKPHLSDGNTVKTMTAPVTAIIAYDLDFAAKLPELFPHDPTAPSWFENEEVALETAFRNGTLQGGYLILAARALGLDCGPMSGFDKAGVDAEFFPDGRLKSNFLCNLGYGDRSDMPPRNPRLAFDAAAELL